MQAPIQSIVRACTLDPVSGLKLTRKSEDTWYCVVPGPWTGKFVLQGACKGYVNANFSGSSFLLDGTKKKIPSACEGAIWEFNSPRSISVVLVLYSKADPKIEPMKRRAGIDTAPPPPSALLNSFYTSKPVDPETEFEDVRVTSEVVPFVAHYLSGKHKDLDYTAVMFWLQDLIRTETRSFTVNYADALLQDQMKRSPLVPKVVEPEPELAPVPVPAPAPVPVAAPEPETKEERRRKFAAKFDVLFAKEKPN